MYYLPELNGSCSTTYQAKGTCKESCNKTLWPIDGVTVYALRTHCLPPLHLSNLHLQLVSCLLCKRCPHYFLPNLDLFRGKSPSALEGAAKQVWRLTRELLTNTRAFEKL